MLTMSSLSKMDLEDHARLVQAEEKSKVMHGLNPILKEELRLKILKRRHAQRKPDITHQLFPEPETHELRPDEVEKREKRRLQNRDAARRSRAKKKKREDMVHQEYDSELRMYQEVKVDIDKLRRNIDLMQEIINTHTASALCTVTSTTTTPLVENGPSQDGAARLYGHSDSDDRNSIFSDGTGTRELNTFIGESCIAVPVPCRDDSSTRLSHSYSCDSCTRVPNKAVPVPCGDGSGTIASHQYSQDSSTRVPSSAISVPCSDGSNTGIPYPYSVDSNTQLPVLCSDGDNTGVYSDDSNTTVLLSFSDDSNNPEPQPQEPEINTNQWYFGHPNQTPISHVDDVSCTPFSLDTVSPLADLFSSSDRYRLIEVARLDEELGSPEKDLPIPSLCNDNGSASLHLL